MKKETIVSAKTVDEALVIASKELGAPVEALEYTVLEEAKKGLFGLGAAPAKVQVSYAPTAIDLAVEFVKTTLKNMNIEAEVIVSDTIPLDSDPAKDKSKITVLSMTDIFANIINKVYNYEEISSSFIN